MLSWLVIKIGVLYYFYMKKIIIIFTAVLLLGAGCNSGNWTGFYYPDFNDMSKWTTSPKLDSLDECRDWVDGVADYSKMFDYECGYKCEYNAGYGLNICEETVN